MLIGIAQLFRCSCCGLGTVHRLRRPRDVGTDVGDPRRPGRSAGLSQAGKVNEVVLSQFGWRITIFLPALGQDDRELRREFVSI
jgi:hypothetical protein